MARGVNKVILVDEFEMYLSGMSIPEVSRETGIALSTLRFRFKKRGILRSRADGVRAAAAKGRLGSGMRGRSRTFTESHKSAIRRARINWGESHAIGTTLKPSGYIEYTRGPHKGRSVHVVKMEDRLGRRLKEDEVVHHIDGDKSNNSESNLALCTRAGHTRLHRREDKLASTE